MNGNIESIRRNGATGYQQGAWQYGLMDDLTYDYCPTWRAPKNEPTLPNCPNPFSPTTTIDYALPPRR